MNSFSKFLLVLFFTIPCAYALQLQALYTSNCQREIGIIVHVDKRSVYLLGLNGKFSKIGRYQIQSIASYPIDHFPLRGEHNISSNIPVYRFWHLRNGVISEFATGMLLGRTVQGYQLFGVNGEELFVPLEQIWKIELVQEKMKISLPKRESRSFQFSHPSRGICQDRPGANQIMIYPNELLSDTVTIKHQLDRNIEAQKKLEREREAQTFYPVPQVYKNRTQIGYWLSLNNRYGSSAGRDSELAPLIRNEFSSGPFGFQHLSLTGNGPIPGSIHEEPQTMLYYSFKASYVSFVGYLDPSLILAGSQYQWQRDDMGRNDHRVVESSHMALGFDRGGFSLKFYLHSNLFGGYRRRENFSRYDGSTSRAALSWQNAHWMVVGAVGLGGNIESKRDDNVNWESGDFTFKRIDITWLGWSNRKLEFSYILRGIDFGATSGESFKNNSDTILLGIEQKVTPRLSLALRVSNERNVTETESTSETFRQNKLALAGLIDF